MEDKKVRDVMLPLSEYATVFGESTVQNAIKALDKAQLGLTDNRHHHRAVLVLDDRGEVIGKLSHWAILRKLEPRFLNAGDLSVLSRANFTDEDISNLEEGLTGFVGSLSALCRRAARIKAKDAMVPISESIDENESLVAAIHQLVVSHVHSLLVTRDGKTIGILRLSDVFQEIAELIKQS
jgi:CBS domain-containing protein